MTLLAFATIQLLTRPGRYGQNATTRSTIQKAASEPMT